MKALVPGMVLTVYSNFPCNWNNVISDPVHFLYLYIFIYFHSAQFFEDLSMLWVSNCTSFHLIAKWYYVGWLYHNLLISSPVDRHLDCFQFLAVMPKAAINLHGHTNHC